MTRWCSRSRAIFQRPVSARAHRRGAGRFGRVDTVVNDAGIFIAKPFTEYTDADFDAITGVNLRGFFEVSRAALAAMEAGGHLVNVSTSLVDQANSRAPSALASLTKGGLNAATKSLAVEYAARGIRVNAVALGIIRHTDARPPPTTPWPAESQGDSATSTTSSTPCSIWSRPASSPARYCTSTVARAPGTDET